MMTVRQRAGSFNEALEGYLRIWKERKLAKRRSCDGATATKEDGVESTRDRMYDTPIVGRCAFATAAM